MLLTEWNTEEAKVVWREEALEEGLVKGRAEGLVEVAKNALAEGASVEFVKKITGLDLETIKNLQVKRQ